MHPNLILPQGNIMFKGLYIKEQCCIARDRTRFDSECAFIYSDNLVIISQVTPVTKQNKNHLEIIQIITY